MRCLSRARFTRDVDSPRGLRALTVERDLSFEHAGCAAARRLRICTLPQRQAPALSGERRGHIRLACCASWPLYICGSRRRTMMWLRGGACRCARGPAQADLLPRRRAVRRDHARRRAARGRRVPLRQRRQVRRAGVCGGGSGAATSVGAGTGKLSMGAVGSGECRRIARRGGNFRGRRCNLQRFSVTGAGSETPTPVRLGRLRPACSHLSACSAGITA